jgi:aspartate kinase
MDIVIQKYGGTSVASAAGQHIMINNVKACIEKNEKPLIVVSAMGRKGDPYATDTLINLYQEIYKGEDIKADQDLLMSCGEVISATLIANRFRAQGLKTKVISGQLLGIVTDDNYGNANVLHVNPSKIREALSDYDLCVVTGFQGVTQDGFITTLGRGGSDATAVLLGEALSVNRVEIYTDVDGVMTADPRMVNRAKVLSEISYEEVYQMAIDGAKVIDSKAIAIAKRAGIDLWVKNTFKDVPGTRIFKETQVLRKAMVTAVTHKNDIVQFRFTIDGKSPMFDKLLDGLAERKISIDLINFLVDEKLFTVSSDQSKDVSDMLETYQIPYKHIANCSKITIIGPGIHGVPGVMRKVVKALNQSQVEILQTSDSYTTISCLIHQESLKKTLETLHDVFELHLTTL